MKHDQLFSLVYAVLNGQRLLTLHDKQTKFLGYKFQFTLSLSNTSGDPDAVLFCNMLRACGLLAVLVTSSRPFSSLRCKPGSHHGCTVNPRLSVTSLLRSVPEKCPYIFQQENPVNAATSDNNNHTLKYKPVQSL